MAIYSETNKLHYLNQAEKIAKTQHSLLNLGWINHTKSSMYLNEGKYGLAMKYILISRDYYLEAESEDNLVNIYHILGDLFFKAGLYEKARENYKKAMVIKGDLAAFEGWRKFTLNNNIGLTFQRENLNDSALFYYNYVLKLIELTPSNQVNPEVEFLDYCYLSSVYLQKENLDSAMIFHKKAEKFIDEKLMDEPNLTYWPINIEIHIKNGDLEEALQSAKMYQKKINGKNILQQANLFQQFSQIYDKQGDVELAFDYLRKFNQIKDSIDIDSENIQSMLLLAEDEHNSLEKELNKNKKVSAKLISLVLVLTALSFVLWFIYYRKRKENLELVQKALNKKAEKLEVNNNKSVLQSREEKILLSKEEEYLKDIYETFMNIFSKEKLFLDAGLTLDKVAKRLNTNRTYLSKAINISTGKNFKTVINEFRVEYAITILKEENHRIISVDSLAEMAGFKSRTGFNGAFKNCTGVSPAFFMKNYKAKSEN